MAHLHLAHTRVPMRQPALLACCVRAERDCPSVLALARSSAERPP